MRATILVAACVLMVSSTFAAEPQVQKVAQAQKAVTVAKAEVPSTVWTLEMSCCQAQ